VVRRRIKCDSHKTITKGIQFQWLFRYSGGTENPPILSPNIRRHFWCSMRMYGTVQRRILIIDETEKIHLLPRVKPQKAAMYE
jgi:hypothetical protein